MRTLKTNTFLLSGIGLTFCEDIRGKEDSFLRIFRDVHSDYHYEDRDKWLEHTLPDFFAIRFVHLFK